MQITGTIENISIDYKTQKSKISLLLDTKQLDVVEQLKNENKLNIEIKKWREKRSLNANNYAWQLITQLANVLSLNKEEVYFQMLQKYGQSEMVSVLANIEVSGFFKHYIEAGESILNEKLFKHYKIYKGSSEYDTKEMALLIDGIIEECRQQGIETMTPGQLSKLKEEWRNE